ncbi:MAG: hypothetical protein Q4A44_01535 [Bacteroidales bacterium]|nr:hypothetical protein [Bacteroidales bacterium]
MKKANYALSALLLAAAASPALAVDIYKKGAVVSQLAAGQEVIIQPATSEAGSENVRYISGSTVTAVPVDSSVYIVEASDASVSGVPAFYFKNRATGKYLAKPSKFTSILFEEHAYAGHVLQHTTDKAEAIAWAAGPVDTVTTTSPFYLAINKNWVNAADTTRGRRNDVFYAPYKADPENTKVVVSANTKITSNTIDYLYLSAYWGGSAPVLSRYKDTNIALFYEVNGLDGQAMLDAAFNLFPSGRGTDIATAFPVGDAIGQYSDQEAIGLLSAAWGAAFTIEAPDQGTNEEKIEAARNLEAAFKAVEATKVPLAEGVYRIKGLGRAADSYMYDTYKGTDTSMYVKREVPAEERDYDFYYYRIARTENGRFTLQNVRSGRYAKGVNQVYKYSVSSTDVQATFEIKPSQGVANAYTLRSSFTNANNYVFHLSGEYNVVIWHENTGSTVNASLWELEKIDEATLEASKAKTDAYIEDILSRGEAVDSLVLYYNSAVRAIDRSRIFTSNATENPTENNDEVPFKAWSNAGHNELSGETDGAGEAALNDNDLTNFFHSLWKAAHAEKVVGPFHNFYIDFGDGQAKSNFVLKLFRRPQTGNNNPRVMEVYGTNDTTEIHNEATWTHVASLANLFVDAADSAAVTGGISSATPYRFYRFDITRTVNGANVDGKPFFALAEINAHEAQYNAAASQFSKIANAEALDAAVKAARAQVYGPQTGFTAEVFNTLRAEYNKFMADYSDLAAVTTAYNTAMITYNGSEESEQERPGYFPTGTRETFKTAIDNARNGVDETSTTEQYKAAIAAINEALETFRRGLYVPKVGQLYKIRSKSPNTTFAHTPRNSYIKADIEPSGLNARWTGNDTTNLENGYLNDVVDGRNEFFWQLVEGDDDSLKLQNIGVGLYLKPSVYANSHGMNFDSIGANLTFQYTDAPGTFAFKFGNFYANAQPQTGGKGSLVLWHAYDANSIFTIEPAEFDKPLGYATSYFNIKKDVKNIITVPYKLQAVETKNQEDVKVYTILGLNEAKTQLVLAEVADPTTFDHPAGVPFVVETVDSVLSLGFDEENLNLTAIPVAAAGGVQGTFNAKRINQPEYGVFNRGKIISNATAFQVPTMSAYVTPAVMTTTEAGQATIDVEGPITNIASAVVIKKGTVDVYTIDGKLVKRGVATSAATTGLSAGIYVVGGVKVVVK